jgi:hypothetical protein
MENDLLQQRILSSDDRLDLLKDVQIELMTRLQAVVAQQDPT